MHAALASAGADLLAHIDAAMIDHVVGAHGLRAREFVVATAGDAHLGAARFADLKRGERDATTDAPDEHIVAFAHLRACDAHPPRGECGQRVRGGDVVGDMRGDHAHIARGHAHILAEGAGQVLAEHAKAGREWMLAARGVLVLDGVDAGVDDDAVAFLQTTARGCHVDHAGAIAAEHPVRRDAHAGQPAHRPQVEVIERGAADADTHPSRGGVGDGEIGAILDVAERTGGADGEAAHGGQVRVPRAASNSTDRLQPGHISHSRRRW